MASDKTQDDKLVGGYVPDWLFRLVNLYSITHDIPKSQVVRDGLLLWIDENDVSEDELASQIAKKFRTHWLRIKNQDNAPTFDEFRRECMNKLIKKGISESVIDKVMNKLNT